MIALYRSVAVHRGFLANLAILTCSPGFPARRW
jgi:hypothetical protein